MPPTSVMPASADARPWLLPEAALARAAPGVGQAARGAAESAASQRYGYRIGGLGLLMAPGQIGEILDGAAIFALPNTAPWLRGLVNVRGSLVPVFDLARLLGLDAAPAPRLLVLGRGDAAVGLHIEGLPRALVLGAPLDERPSLPALLAPHVQRVYGGAGEYWCEFELTAFLESLGGQMGA